jgi:two-component system copper resistance phosphate regulon response regulator CusR
MRVLLVEDNPRMQASIEKGLREQGYAVAVCETGREGEETAMIETFDLLILDVMLPDRDGVEVCRNLRRRGVTTPILMLTALTGTDDKVKGLDAGADDYLGKPFEYSELQARVRALLRRGQAVESTRLGFADLRVDLATRQVKRGEKELKLTPKEFALLEYLLRHPERVLSRTEIGEHVWDMNFDPFSNVIDVYISMLRKKVDRGFDRPLIHTVVGTGYMLSEQAAAV